MTVEILNPKTALFFVSFLPPALAAEGVTAARLARLARRLERADQALGVFAATTLQAVRLSDGALDFHRLAAFPEEIVLRVLHDRLHESTQATPDRLERLEALCAALNAAHRSSQPLVRTLAKTVVSLDRAGRLAFEAEGPRRRGVSHSLQHKAEFPSPERLADTPSLGKGTPASYIGMVDAPALEPDVVEPHSVPDAGHRGPMLSAGP